MRQEKSPWFSDIVSGVEWELVHKEKLMVQFFHHFIQQVPHKGIKLMRFKSKEKGTSQKGPIRVSLKVTRNGSPLSLDF